jgi:hypothetical protein
MGSRFNMAVVLVWLAAMSWLVVVKVLPPLQKGDPPNYKAILANSAEHPPVCWAICWNDQPVGFAASIIVRRDDNMREIHSRVFFSQLPLDEMAPGWLGAIVRPMLTRVGNLDMDAQSRLEIDPLDHLAGFESRVRLANIPDAIRMNGVVDGTQLKLSVHSGDFSYRTEKYLPPEALVGDELSPQAHLPGLHKGQTWTMPVYSPFRPPNSPLEILQATVERDDSIIWNGKPCDTLMVVYRADSGSGILSPQHPKGKLWVRKDGLVVKQQVHVFNSRLYFIRLSPTDGKKLIDELTHTLGAEWDGPLSSDRAKDIWSQLSIRESGELKQATGEELSAPFRRRGRGWRMRQRYSEFEAIPPISLPHLESPLAEPETSPEPGSDPPPSSETGAESGRWPYEAGVFGER